MAQLEPEWFSAIGTVGALVVALALLGVQMYDRRRETKDRQRAQAEMIGAVIGPSGVPDASTDPATWRTAIDLFNTSPSPVYELVAGIVLIQGAGSNSLEEVLGSGGRVTTIAVLPPGTFRAWIDGVGWAAMGARPGAEVAFTDRAGHHWVRRVTGQLHELDKTPLEYFGQWGLFGPYEMQSPERVG